MSITDPWKTQWSTKWSIVHYITASHQLIRLTMDGSKFLFVCVCLFCEFNGKSGADSDFDSVCVNATLHCQQNPGASRFPMCRSSCSQYAECTTEGSVDQHQCESGYTFDSEHQQCEEGSAVACSPVRCINTCEGEVDGDYHACATCSSFISCSNGRRQLVPCPLNQAWDDTRKRCQSNSLTCPECVRSCENKTDGSYQSCETCEGYISCSNGFLYNMTCPDDEYLVWNDNTKRCEYTSPTCRRPRTENGQSVTFQKQ